MERESSRYPSSQCARPRIRASLALASALVALAASRGANADCTKDDECKGARICEKGRCVDPPPPKTKACQVDVDCPGDDVCIDRVCKAPAKPAQTATPAVPPPAPPAAPPVTPPPAPPPPPPSAPSAAPAPQGGLLYTSNEPAPAPPAAPTPANNRAPLGRSTINLYLDGAFFGAASSNPALHVWGLRGDIGAAALIGFQPHFPDRNGGNWHGADIRAQIGPGLGGAVYSDGNHSFFFGLNGTLILGYEFLHFARLGADQLEQRGLGAFIGPRLGFQVSLLGQGGADATAGATASFILASFSAKERGLMRTMLNLDVWTLPGTGTTFFSIGVGAALP